MKDEQPYLLKHPREILTYLPKPTYINVIIRALFVETKVVNNLVQQENGLIKYTFYSKTYTAFKWYTKFVRIDKFQKHDVEWKITLRNHKYSAKNNFLKIFIYFRNRQSMGLGGEDRGRARISSRLPTEHRDGQGLNSEILTWATIKSQMFNYWDIQGSQYNFLEKNLM